MLSPPVPLFIDPNYYSRGRPRSLAGFHRTYLQQEFSMSPGDDRTRCQQQQQGQGGETLPPPINDVDVAGIVTQEFFDGILNQARKDSAGRGFYTLTAFLEALKPFPCFGRVGSPDDSRREIAAFFAHVTHETGHFSHIEEICDPSENYCDTRYPFAPGKRYYGRGPMQLTWNYNYAAAGESIGFDGLGSPETVAGDPVVAFKTALWYWMERVHRKIISGGGFGATIRAINGGECGGRNPVAVSRRVRFYKEYCTLFGVSPGDNLTC